MENTDLLLHMLEQPQQYTDEQWRDILADEECRALYTLMAKTQSAVSVQQSRPTDKDIDLEWQHFESKHFSQRTLHLAWHKVAAIFIGIMVVSSIAFATVHLAKNVHSSHSKNLLTEEVAGNEKNVTPRPDEQTADSTAAQPVLYDNVPLEVIFANLASHYHVEVSYANDSVRHIRLFYQWRPTYSLTEVIDMLNHFETFHLHLEDNTLMVKQQTSK